MVSSTFWKRAIPVLKFGNNFVTVPFMLTMPPRQLEANSFNNVSTTSNTTH